MRSPAGPRQSPGGDSRGATLLFFKHFMTLKFHSSFPIFTDLVNKNIRHMINSWVIVRK